jgi:SLAP domain-containing protein
LTLDALSLTKTNLLASTNNDLQAYRIQATIRNSSQLTIQTPDIELTASNAQGNVIARRTFSAQQLGAAPTLPANSDWLIDSSLQLDAQTVGYTARLVY